MVLLVTLFVVRVEVDTFDSVLPVGVTVVKDVDCGSAGEDTFVVDASWLLSES